MSCGASLAASLIVVGVTKVEGIRFIRKMMSKWNDAFEDPPSPHFPSPTVLHLDSADVGHDGNLLLRLAGRVVKVGQRRQLLIKGGHQLLDLFFRLRLRLLHFAGTRRARRAHVVLRSKWKQMSGKVGWTVEEVTVASISILEKKRVKLRTFARTSPRPSLFCSVSSSWIRRVLNGCGHKESSETRRDERR